MPRSFAHLLGLGRPAAGKSSADKPDDQRDDETDEEYQDRKKREQEEADKPADQRDDETDEEYRDRKKREQEEADKKDDSAKGKKANDEDEDGDESMSDDDSDDKEDRKDAKATAARRRERARCAAIFGSKHAAARPDMAAHYAFATNLTRREARAALAAVAAGEPKAIGGLARRMGGMEQLRPGAGSPSSAPSISASWDAAAKSAGLVK